MKTVLAISILALAAGHSAYAAPDARHQAHRQHPTANGSFLGTKVYSVPDLIEQIENDPAVAARYARHYHQPASEIVQYLKANVVESYVPRTQTYRTYWVRHSGAIVAKPERLTRGVRVFALRNGDPVLKWACGNPLTASLPYVETKVTYKPPKPVEHFMPSAEVLVPAEPPDVIIPSEPAAPPPATMVAAEPPAPIDFSHQAMPVVHHPGFPIGALIPIAAVPIIIGTTHHPSDNPPPTPEAPTGIAFAGLALLGFAYCFRRSAQT